MKKIRFAESAFDAIVDAMAVFSGVLLILVMLSVFLEVIMRYFLNRPLFWVTEVAEFSLLFITFTAATWILKNDGHVKLDIITMRLDVRKGTIVDIFSSLIGIFVCVVLTYFGARVTIHHFVERLIDQGLLNMPIAMIIFIIPVVTFLLSIQYVRRIYNLFKQLRTSNSQES
jgi:TRAP-type C4-dicarboxylate transport system permease small subunit